MDNELMIIGLKIILMITFSLLLWFLFAMTAGNIFDKKYIKKPTTTPVDFVPPRKSAAPTPAYTHVAKESAPKSKRTQADPHLLIAVATGNWSNAHQLLKFGADPNGVDKNGHSLMDIAIKNKDKHMIKLLHSNGVPEGRSTR